MANETFPCFATCTDTRCKYFTPRKVHYHFWMPNGEKRWACFSSEFATFLLTVLVFVEIKERRLQDKLRADVSGARIATAVQPEEKALFDEVMRIYTRPMRRE